MSHSKSLVNPKLLKYFKDYAYYHQTKGNQMTHYFGITMIVMSLLGLLANVSLFETPNSFFQYDAGILLMLASLVFYLFLDWKIALPFALAVLGIYFLGRSLPTSVNWGLFIVGWILQGIGHYVYEKKSPAFAKNLTHLLIGPLWVFAKIVGYR